MKNSQHYGIQFKKPTIVYKKNLAFPPASQQAIAVKYYTWTLAGLNKPSRFYINIYGLHSE